MFALRSLMTSLVLSRTPTLASVALPLASGTNLLFTRGKRNKANRTRSPATERVLTQLKMISQRRKQPKLLLVCQEDHIRHETIATAYRLFCKERAAAQAAVLEKQYQSIQTAMAELEQLDAYLFHEANVNQKGKRFDLEMRIPTDFPPNEVWLHQIASGNEK